MSDLILNIKNLREITGAGFLDCKKALQENNEDIEASINFLRKKGLAKANKKSLRDAKEGAVGIYSNEKITSIIQINTETDFAAKNYVFLDFMDKIGNYVLLANDKDLSIESFSSKEFEGNTINNLFTDIIAKIGENIVLNNLHIINHEDHSLISTYIHNGYKKNIGKIGVILKSNVDKINKQAIDFGKNLCMHIAASKPLSINIEQLDQDLIEKERKVQLETIKSSGKPDNIIEKILDGKMKKFYSESTLLNQPYIFEPEKSVNELLNSFSNENKFNIVDYKLIVIGS